MPLDGNDYSLRGLGAVGDAVMRAGSVMGAMAQKRQEATDRRLVNSAQAAMDQAAIEFQQWQAANPNAPESWAEEARTRADGLMKPFLEMKELSRSAKDDLALMGKSWAGRFVGNVEVQGTKAVFGLAKESYVGRARRAFDSNNFEGGKAALDEGVAGGYLHETDRDALLYEGQEKQKARTAEGISGRYEIAVQSANEELLNQTINEGKTALGWDKDYAEAKRLKGMEGIEQTRRVNAAQEESDFLGEVMMKKAQGEVFVPEQVDSWVSEGRIDKQTGARLRVALKSEVGAMTGEFMDFLNKEVDVYDPDSDPDGLKTYELQKKSDLLGLNQRQRELYSARLERAAKVNADPKLKPLEAVRRAAKGQIGEMFKEVGKSRVWDDDLEGALRDPAKLEAWGVPVDQAQGIKLLIEGGTDKKGMFGKANEKVIPDKAKALKLFRDQSLARKERGESGLTAWEYDLYQKAADASGDMVADPMQQQWAEFNRAVLEEGFDNWYDSETAKRGAPPSDVEARQWVGDKSRAVIQGVGAANLFKTSEVKPAKATTPATPATPGAIDEPTVSMIKDFESFIPEAYGDYKQTSVGYGTRARFDGEVLTEPEADARLRDELQGHVSRVDSLAAENGVKLTEAQRSALISFDFNTGAVHRVFERGGADTTRYAPIMKEWRKAGGKVLPGLVARRAKEAAAFE
jgi:GH24 family phage-related lysozyme (muramidase)